MPYLVQKAEPLVLGFSSCVFLKIPALMLKVLGCYIMPISPIQLVTATVVVAVVFAPLESVTVKVIRYCFALLKSPEVGKLKTCIGFFSVAVVLSPKFQL